MRYRYQDFRRWLYYTHDRIVLRLERVGCGGLATAFISILLVVIFVLMLAGLVFKDRYPVEKGLPAPVPAVTKLEYGVPGEFSVYRFCDLQADVICWHLKTSGSGDSLSCLPYAEVSNVVTLACGYADRKEDGK